MVNIGSTSGYYGRANAGLPDGKERTVRTDEVDGHQLGPHGIRVNLVAPNRAGSPVGQSEVNQLARLRI